MPKHSFAAQIEKTPGFLKNTIIIQNLLRRRNRNQQYYHSKRVRLHLADSAVEKWVNNHGRPLGVALGHNGEAIVADGYKGLLNISRDGEVEVLAEKADGLKFKLADGVDVADSGMIYFTDASYKYSMEDSVWDVLEGTPHGRLMSLLPEKPGRRCRKYYIEGNKQGELEKFVDNLTGLPDNIKYDGEGHYWIALATGNSVVLDLALRYAFIRKAMGLMEKYIGGLSKGKNAGLEDCQRGKMQVTSAVKIGNRLYCGSFVYPHITSLDLNQHPARSTVSVSPSIKSIDLYHGIFGLLNAGFMNISEFDSTTQDWLPGHNLRWV
ncbi:hypothetical protein Golob_007454 [Gossypium lobatum]|uniref:Strictosidine synthase conserved region domain-containing protein n=1 Tax=Gossypium lobatum TaxID=34289 RepID=A0A7J8MCF6_9ROSI|nr:hypothetical protein [Gossypium lobatum]